MTKKEQFLAFVLVGALVHDYATNSNDLPMMLRVAASIPEEDLTDDPMNSAKAFLDFYKIVVTRPQARMLKRN